MSQRHSHAIELSSSDSSPLLCLASHDHILSYRLDCRPAASSHGGHLFALFDELLLLPFELADFLVGGAHFLLDFFLPFFGLLGVGCGVGWSGVVRGDGLVWFGL